MLYTHTLLPCLPYKEGSLHLCYPHFTDEDTDLERPVTCPGVQHYVTIAVYTRYKEKEQERAGMPVHVAFAIHWLEEFWHRPLVAWFQGLVF